MLPVEDSMPSDSPALASVPGFTFSAIKCGIRYPDRLDLALIYSQTPCVACGTFTANRLAAAPVRLCRERIDRPIHAILINSTNANACTGDTGYENAITLASAVSRRLSISDDSVLMASTGIIGVQLPVDTIERGIPKLIDGLSTGQGPLIKQAIMTTDTFPKEAGAYFTHDGRRYAVAGVAKGAGMIAPNMATMLAFVITDAPIARKDLDPIFRRCIDTTFNAITIDGDMSTNDTALILAPDTGQPLTDETALESFEAALLHTTRTLAEMIVRDGEGATRLVTVTVRGAKTDDDARTAARAIAESLLVKTALFGRDPNWGRIACAAGYSGAAFDERTLSISIESVQLLTDGVPLSFDKTALLEIMSRREYEIHVNLGLGSGRFSFMTTDLSYDYVKINAEYST